MVSNKCSFHENPEYLWQHHAFNQIKSNQINFISIIKKHTKNTILGIRNTCAASGCLSFPDAAWEKVDNFVIVTNVHYISELKYSSPSPFFFLRVYRVYGGKVRKLTYRILLPTNIYETARLLHCLRNSAPQSFSISTFSRGALGK